jgi:hypothetical protein
MPKLHLKRTPAEEAERQFRKSQKAARKAAKKRFASHPYDFDDSNPGESSRSESRSPSHKRPRKSSDHEQPGYSSVGDHGSVSDDIEYGPEPPPPPSSSRKHKPDYDAIRAQLEEERFREKMWGAFEDDERLDGVEARLNDFAHIPNRWRDVGGRGPKGNENLYVDPQHMEEEEYTEWIRAGMWRRVSLGDGGPDILVLTSQVYRKQHAEEHASQTRQQAAKSAQRAREKALKAETRRLEKAAEEEWKRLKQEKERRKLDEAREAYDRMWRELLDRSDGNGEKGKGRPSEETLRFADIPWPVLAHHHRGKRRSKTVSLDDLTAEAISTFLLPSKGGDQVTEKKERKEKIRETMLRFHPDKFESRVMRRVAESEKEIVLEAVGIVVRAVGELMVTI